LKYLLLIILFLGFHAYGQQKISITNSDNEPIANAILYSDHSPIAKSDKQGVISLPESNDGHLEIIALGYEEYELALPLKTSIVVLQRKKTKEVVIKATKLNNSKSTGTEVIDKCELGKLACCNLAESFENSNTVDVNYSDGVTGGREIQMLALAGGYSQQLIEGAPYQRGILSKIGLELVPGPWLDGISINKGIGSVTNGFDNISGQINLDFAKPKKSLDWFLNGYISEIGKTDLNLIKGYQIKENLYTSILAHTQFSKMTMDNNNDGFTDMPTFSNFNVMNRWQYFGDNGMVVNAVVQAVNYDYRAGQILDHHPIANPFVIEQNTRSYQAMLKTGWELDAVKNTSFAVISRFNFASQSGFIGKRIQENSEVFVNLSPVYQTNLNDSLTFKFGGQLLLDRVHERLDTIGFHKNDIVSGAFSELILDRKIFQLILGLRGDYHNTLGFFGSPRASLTLRPSENHILKLSSGIGFRTPTYLTESSSFLISNRAVMLPSELQAERGWNSGISYKRFFKFLNNTSHIEASCFLTLFQNQMLINIETPELLKLEYLKDGSRAQSFQIELEMKLPKKWQLRISYKNDQTIANFDGVQKQIPLLKQDKFLTNISWTSPNDKWKASGTFLAFGSSRIPILTTSQESESPIYTTTHAQINYVPSKKFDFYIGSENIFSFAQQDRIQNYWNPEQPSFDAGMIWGPMDIRRLYVGAKFNF
jgi:outer membrane receptor for ferrienterochelin and colicin